jgi:hypothetical protein
MPSFNYGDYVMVRYKRYGYLMSPGFTDDRVFVQEVKDFNLVLNVRDMLFQVLPELQYYSTYAHRTFMKQHPGTLNEYEAKRLSDMTKAKDDEDEKNKQTISINFNKSCPSGGQFQLLHFKSQVMLGILEKKLITNESGNDYCQITYDMHNGNLKMRN